MVALGAWGPSNALAAQAAPPGTGVGGDADALPPVVVGGGGGAAVAPAAPAAGAQPAAPGAVGELPQVDVAGANPVDVAADAAAIAPDAAMQDVEVGADEVVAPIELDVTPVVSTPKPAAGAPPVVVDGGGTGGGATVAPAPAATPTGTLPFTGAAENLLLMLLAAMLVPIGVLLYSAARGGELRARRRLLSMPRFQWAAAAHQDPSGALQPRRELQQFGWIGQLPFELPTDPALIGSDDIPHAGAPSALGIEHRIA